MSMHFNKENKQFDVYTVLAKIIRSNFFFLL